MTLLKKLLVSTSLAALIGTTPALAADKPSLEPVAKDFIASLEKAGGPPLYTLSPAEARKVLESAQSGPVAKLAADIEDRTIPVGPLGKVDLRIVRPKGDTSKLPVIMYFHGGGWVLGDKNTHDRVVREIANGARAAVIFVDYVRSPEAQYPAPIEEAYAATKYVAEHPDQFNVDATRLAVVGDSVGGNMTIAVTLLAKERGGPRIARQVLFYPVTDARFDTGSYDRFAEGPWLTRKAMQWFWDQYLPDVAKRKEPTASPLRASLEQLKGLPSALIVTDENDVLRDEGEAFAARLAEAGVPVTQVRYLGTIHDFVMLNAVSTTPAARGAIDQATAMLRRAFGR